ncbi:hypothetical protein IPA_02375 [Ignicoccus pacificus DSM 13166]|uniref:Uncharacterized protein n=1 Tax=Ignicoccus pacificus DSM 13166 TaxID=940294 RepID=A0A977KAQ5_9CREN|nr:hypothetical protein IPA_02375 [Ignicoccus pacificus DSM 13166]
MRVIRKGGIGNIIALTVMIILLAATLVLLLNTISSTLTITQSGSKSIQKAKVSYEITKKLNMCYFTGYLGSVPVIAIKTNDPATLCTYLQALQLVEYGASNSTMSFLIPGSDIRNELNKVLYSVCKEGLTNSVTVDTDTGTKMEAQVVLTRDPTTLGVEKLQALVKGVGWVPIGSCNTQVGSAVNIQSTTILYSIGPVTIIAAQGTNPLVYMCPSPRQVFGDSNAYVIAMMLTPNMTTAVNSYRNHIPTSVVIDLKDLIKKVATSGSPLLLPSGDVNPNDYLRGIRVIQMRYGGGVLPGAFGTGSNLPWSYTFLNLSAAQPLYKSSGVLTFDFYVNSTQGILSTEAAGYGALVCLYVGIAGSVPASSTGEPFDGKLISPSNDVTPPGAKYPCYSFYGYDVCYEAFANATSAFATNLTSAAGLKFEGLQEPVDSTVRVNSLVINNPTDQAILGGCGYAIRIDLNKTAPDAVGKPITIRGPQGENIPFCYETIYGNCTTDPTKGDGAVWIKIPAGMIIPPKGSVSLTIKTGKNGAVNPKDVFPSYVDFSWYDKSKVIGAHFVPYFPNSWSVITNGGAQLGQLVAIQFNTTNDILLGKNFTLVADVRWDGAPNYYYPDKLLPFFDPLSFRGWVAEYLDTIYPGTADEGAVGYWLYPIIYEIDPTATGDVGWMLAIYNGYPTAFIIKYDPTLGVELVPEAVAPNPIAPGVRYFIVLSNDTSGMNISVIPAEEFSASTVKPLADVPAPTNQDVVLVADTNSLLNLLYNQNSNAIVLSDAGIYRVYNTVDGDVTQLAQMDVYQIVGGRRSQVGTFYHYTKLYTISSFSGRIYNVTAFNVTITNPAKAINCYLTPSTCSNVSEVLSLRPFGSKVIPNITADSSNGTVVALPINVTIIGSYPMTPTSTTTLPLYGWATGQAYYTSSVGELIGQVVTMTAGKINIQTLTITSYVGNVPVTTYTTQVTSLEPYSTTSAYAYINSVRYATWGFRTTLLALGIHVNEFVPGSFRYYDPAEGVLPLGAKVELAFINSTKPTDYVLAELDGVPTGQSAINLTRVILYANTSMITNGHIVLNGSLGIGSWNLMILKSFPTISSCSGNAFSIVTLSNGGSDAFYDSQYDYANVYYAYAPALISDGRSWMKWMLYEDSVDGYRVEYVRSGIGVNAWRLYYYRFKVAPTSTFTNPNTWYYTKVYVDMNTWQTLFTVNIGGPSGPQLLADYGDLSSTSLVSEYPQLLPSDVKYIGIGYTAVRSGEYVRKLAYVFAYRQAPPTLEVLYHKSDINSPLIDAPLIYVKKSGVIASNVSGVPQPFNATYHLYGAQFNYLYPSDYLEYNQTVNYGYLTDNADNLTVPFSNISSALKAGRIQIAGLWSDKPFNMLRMDEVPLNVSIVGKWIVYAWSNVTEPLVLSGANNTNVTLYMNNVTVALSPYTSDLIITFNNITKMEGPVAIGLFFNNTFSRSIVILANVTDGTGNYKLVDGLLSWEALNSDLSKLNGTSIIMINKMDYHMTVNGPMCVPIPPEMGGMGTC